MSSHPWHLIDGLVLAYLALGTFLGFRRGLWREVLRLIGHAMALVTALALYRPTGAWIAAHTRLEEGVARGIAFGLTVATVGATILVFRLMAKALSPRGASTNPQRVGGSIVGFLGSAVAVVLVFFAAAIWPHPYLNRQFGEASRVGQWIQRYLTPVRERIEGSPLAKTVREHLDGVMERRTRGQEARAHGERAPSDGRPPRPSDSQRLR